MALCREFAGRAPQLNHPAFVAETAVLIGDVRLEADASVFYGAVLRADHDSITVGQGSNIQDNAVLHADSGCPLRIGKNVTVGHGAVVHGCTVEDGALIGMHATVLNGAVIGEGCIVAAGALVTEGFAAPPHSVVMGVPARVRGQARPGQLEANVRSAANYVDCARAHAAWPALPPETEKDNAK